MNTIAHPARKAPDTTKRVPRVRITAALIEFERCLPIAPMYVALTTSVGALPPSTARLRVATSSRENRQQSTHGTICGKR